MWWVLGGGGSSSGRPAPVDTGAVIDALAPVLVVVAAVGVGVLSGVLAGMLGGGGAVVSTPAVRVLGASPNEAFGTTVPASLVAVALFSLPALVTHALTKLAGLRS